MSTGREWEAWAAVGVTVHLRPGVTLDWLTYSDEGRTVLRVLGTNSCDVTLFANLADLDRFVEMVNAARAELAAGMATVGMSPYPLGPELPEFELTATEMSAAEESRAELLDPDPADTSFV